MIKEADKFVENSILEGMVSISALIKAREEMISDRAIIKILLDSSKFDTTKSKSKSRELNWLKNKAARHDFEIEMADTSLIESKTIGNTHGGVIAICGERSFETIQPENIKDNGFYVMLEGIEDPYNFGYTLRSLYAAGVDGIILTPRNWMSAAGVVCRASAGASELFKMYLCSPETPDLFKSKGYRIICADKNNSVSAYESNLKLPLFLIVGGEKRGISRAILDKADAIVHLDYGRDFPAALSTASAASILSFEILRQNIKTGN